MAKSKRMYKDIFKNWKNSGLLDGLLEEDARRMAYSLETLAAKNDERRAERVEDSVFARLDVITLPILRRVFGVINDGSIVSMLRPKEREMFEKNKISPREALAMINLESLINESETITKAVLIPQTFFMPELDMEAEACANIAKCLAVRCVRRFLSSKGYEDYKEVEFEIESELIGEFFDAQKSSAKEVKKISYDNFYDHGIYGDEELKMKIKMKVIN